MAKIADTYYSIAHPKVFMQDGERVTRQIISCFKNISPKLDLNRCTALDIGGSNGVISYDLARYLKHVISIDTDKEAIRDGKKNYSRKNLELKVFNGEKIPYPDNFFDLVIYRRTYGSVDDKEGMSGEIFRVLKPGGLCYFEGHNKLFLIETDHFIPFLPILPDKLAKIIISIFKGQKTYYIERYETFWGNKKLLSQFEIQMLTAQIIKNPRKFQFRNLFKLAVFTRFIPLFLLKCLEPFYPDFIWVIKKPS